jgi:folate/biopterin transporter
MMAEEDTDITIATSLIKNDRIRGRNKRQKNDSFDGNFDPEASEKDQFLKRVEDSSTQDDDEELNHFQKVLKWCHSLRSQFGDALLLQIFFVYFTQGIRSTLCSLGTSYYLKETLSLVPSQAEALRATAAIPWIIKPFYGMLSDSVPIWGTRRKSYLLIFSGMAAMCYVALSIPGFIQTYERALVFLVTASLGIAFCDVVIDGKVVEAARSEKEEMAGNLQTLSWISLSIGSVLGSAISGFTLNHFGPEGVFFLTALGPFCVVLLSLRIPEENFRSDQSFFHTAKEQCLSLAKVVADPICWRPVLWLFLSNALPPSINEAMFNFKTVELQFSKSFLGFISTIGSITLLCTTAAYNAYFRDMPFQKMFLRIQLASAGVSFLEFILVSRLNVSFGIGDHFFIFGDEILSDVVGRLKHMPSLVLCAKICPPGIEGTMFALLMSIYNFSWSMASYGGSYLCSYLHISKNDFSGLAIAVIIRSIGKLVPIFLLFLIPKTTSIHSVSSSSSTTSSSNSKSIVSRKMDLEANMPSSPSSPTSVLSPRRRQKINDMNE